MSSTNVLNALLLLFCNFAPFASSAAPYAAWAHSHMTWLVAGSSQTEMRAMLDGYEARNITVGALNIDSGWSTGFNDFIVDKTQFPDFQAWLDELHGRSLRVLLWMTSMIDKDSSNFQDAFSKGFFIRDSNGNQYTNLSWWHGTGGLLDYSQPDARTWWENAMKAEVLGLKGIDGWKCDGTDPYIIELIEPRGLNGPITFEEYSSYYYGHTLNFTRTINPEALIWSRPVDSFPLFLNISAYLKYSPHYVMFSGWVGDNDPDFSGLRDAAINILESAWQNYTNFGSDTGGYRGAGPQHNRTAEVFLRWAQLNAFLPLFENGGNNDHTPWSFDEAGSTAITDAYRRLVNAHYALGPYFLSTGTTAFSSGISALTPTSAPPVDFPFILEPNQVTDWSLALGPYIFTSPIVYENVTEQKVNLPNSAQSAALAARFGFPPPSNGWLDFWSNATYSDGDVVTYYAPYLNVNGDDMKHPVFVKAGSIIPFHISSALPLIPSGNVNWASALTIFVALLDIETSANYVVHDFSAEGIVDECLITVTRTTTGYHFEWNEYHRPLVFYIRLHRAEPLLTNAKWTSNQTSYYLKRKDESLTPHADSDTSAALPWDLTSPTGGRYPLKGNKSRDLLEGFHKTLASSWAMLDNHLAVFLGMAEARHSGSVVVGNEEV
jgi:alpha-glucosidase (family GH31 glycosyl hydrolase)